MKALKDLLQRKLQLLDDLRDLGIPDLGKNSDNSKNTTKTNYLKILSELLSTDKLICLHFEDTVVDWDSADSSGLTNFHVLSTLPIHKLKPIEWLFDILSQVTDINQQINADSPIWSEYTALHFAAHCSVEVVQVLVANGANLLAETTAGLRPLDIYIKSFSLKEVHSLLTSVASWKDIEFSDGKTKLMDYVNSLCGSYSFNKFLQLMSTDVRAFLPTDSPLWPGWTMLHVAVKLLREVDSGMVEEIIKKKADVSSQDIQGLTPVHLAFHLEKWKFVDLFLSYYKKSVNYLDENNLSYVHIAAAVNDLPLTKRLLRSRTDVNVAYKGKALPSVKPGWTPLHTAVFNNHSAVAKWLLHKGAKLLRKDARGLTAIHVLLGANPAESTLEALLSSNQLKECVVEGVGLTHLHAVVWQNDAEAIETLLDLGSNIEATIGYQVDDEELKKFEGCRPIHVAMMDLARWNAFDILLRRGADIFAKKLDGSGPFVEILTGKYNAGYLESTVRHLWIDEKLQKKVADEMGLTMLHLACYALNFEKIKELVRKGFDVNAKVRDDSMIWPGWTPLHALVSADSRDPQEKNDELFNLLLDNKADVAVGDGEGDTAVHMAMKNFKENTENTLVVFLLGNQLDYSVNPVDKFGMSHFHLTCILNEVEFAGEFLKHMDVNQRVTSSETSSFSGRTPLHCALSLVARNYYTNESQLRMVNLLVEHGADVHAVDDLGCTPLHMLVTCTATRHALYDVILVDNTDINKRANNGKTPVEILLREAASSQELKYFVERGAHLNSYNPVSDLGYMAIVLESKMYKKFSDTSDILSLMTDSLDITKVEDGGRNAIHNAVSIERPIDGCYEYSDLRGFNLIEELITLGCNIFQQDSQGRTPLHLAVKFKNEGAVTALLQCGADVNIIDSLGKSPFAYASEFRKDENSDQDFDSKALICQILARHVKLLQYVGLQVSELNKMVLKKVENEKKYIQVCVYKPRIDPLLEDVASIEICEGKFTLRDLLYQTGLVNLYWKPGIRDSIDSVFKSCQYRKFKDLQDMLNLQYRRARERSTLLEAAKIGLRILLGFPLPDLCMNIILNYLTNWDLKNVTTAAFVVEVKSVTVD